MNRGHDDYMIHEISVMADVPEHEVLAKFKMTLAFMDAKARLPAFIGDESGEKSLYDINFSQTRTRKFFTISNLYP
jgi:hypothetical protein